ncbi:MAG: glutathione synthetase [Saprospiraceae bacterium]|nr:glutathione synthetase [Saprospiraceae bacterium]
MRILVLTDSTHHSPENSVYGIVNALYRHPRVTSIILVNRAQKKNQPFFNAESPELFGHEINGEIKFPLDFRSDQLNRVDLSRIDFCFLRIARPIHDQFFKHLVSLIPDRNIINRPSGIHLTSNKAFLLELTKFTVDMKLCNNWKDIEEFYAKHACVLKPLLSYGGKGIVKIKEGHVDYENSTMTIEAFKSIYNNDPQPYLAMEYAEQVSKGDKRIVVAGGKILACSLRLPKEGEWLCNIAQGGSSHITEPDKTELEMVHYISPILEEKGIFYFGLDTLVGNDGERFISEINTLSIGGIVPAEKITGLNITGQFADLFINYCESLI